MKSRGNSGRSTNNNASQKSLINRSQTNLLNKMRRRDSNSIDTAVRMSAEREKDGTLNVVVEKMHDPVSDEKPILVQAEPTAAEQNEELADEYVTRGVINSTASPALQSTLKQEILTDRVQTQVLATSPDTTIGQANFNAVSKLLVSSGTNEVLVSQDQIGKDISHFINKYHQRKSSPLQSPQKQAYLLGQNNLSESLT